MIKADNVGAAQERKSSRSFEAPERQRRAKFLLSGLLKCGCCGGGLAMKDRDHGRVRIHCSTMKETGTCSNRKIFYMDEIEKSVLAGLQSHLKAPHFLKEFVTAYLEERRRLASEKTKRRSQTKSQLAQLNVQSIGFGRITKTNVFPSKLRDLNYMNCKLKKWP